MSSKPVVAVVGTGLIGTSVALALKQSEYCEKILGASKNIATVQEAVDKGAIDEILPDMVSAKKADVIFLAAPVGAIIKHISELGSAGYKGKLVIDAGSVKTPVIEAAENSGIGRYFVGGHPMAGSEKSGPKHARADLFNEKTFFLVTTNQTSIESLHEAEKLVEALGAISCRITPVEHDRTVALTSHLPYLIAAALSDTACNADFATENLSKAIAGGFKDLTRIAGGSPKMWADILSMNSKSIKKWLGRFSESVEKLLDASKNVGLLENHLNEIRSKKSELFD